MAGQRNSGMSNRPSITIINARNAYDIALWRNAKDGLLNFIGLGTVEFKRLGGDHMSLGCKVTKDAKIGRHEIDILTLANASRRVAQYLCQEHEAGNGQIKLSVPKRLIASQLGIQPETFSRILHRLMDAGLIAMERRNICVLDKHNLASYCE
ncbi:Crp-like helix-turn-helix domain protein [compost metagenome]